MRVTIRCAAALLATGLLCGQADASQAAAAPPLRIQFETSPLVECHSYLRTYGTDSLKPDPSLKLDLASEAGLYTEAAATIQDKAAWRWFGDLVVAGPDPAAVREAARTLPAAIDSDRTRNGIAKLVGAYESAYPKFLEGFWPEQQRALNRLLVPARKRYRAAEQRICGALTAEMGFAPIDAPITVYVVVRSGGVSSWGKVAAGYHTTVDIFGESGLSVIESGLREATYVIDAVQPFDSNSVLRRLRQGLGTDAPGAADTFLRGLITYNAGALVQRFLDNSYKPAGVMAPAHRDAYQPYLSTYEYIWRGYLDGKIAAEAIVPKLIEEFRAVRKLAEEGK